MGGSASARDGDENAAEELSVVGRHQPELPCRTLINPPPSRSLYIPLDLRSKQI